ncbi:MAG: MFS transporter [Qipengyuania sp.]
MSVYTQDASLAYRRSVEFWAITSSPAYLVTGLFGYLFLIYATDTLLLAPAAIGTLLAITKVYDGVSDLALGAWSDRTISRFGRRRPYMVAGGVLLLSYIGVWLPPESLGPVGTLIFIGIMLLLWETANTLIGVPFNALGIENGQTPKRRTLFIVIGMVVGLPGSIAAIFLMQHLVGSGDVRAAGAPFFIAFGIGLSAIVTVAALRVKELPVRHHTVERSFVRMLKEVLTIPYHNRLLAVQMTEAFAFTSIAFMVPYVMTYIVGRADLIMYVFLAYLLLNTLSRIAWVMLIPRWGMQRIWLTGLWLWVITFALFPLVFPFGFVAYLGVALLGGVASGAASVNYAMLGDVADYDARQSGRQRQGMYMTIYRLVSKIAGAAVAFLLGWMLQLSGFVPNTDQGTWAIVAIAASTSILPLLATLMGIRWLQGYDFYEREGLSDGSRDFIERGTLDETNMQPALP